MWGAVAFNLAVIGISYAYHRHEQKSLKNKTAKPQPAREISVPRTDDGAPIPILYGRCRVRAPWLAWVANAAADANDPEGDDLAHGAPFVYKLHLFFVVGIPFANGTNRVREVWVDDAKLRGTLGIGTVASNEEETVDNVGGTWLTGTGFVGQFATYYDGRDDQLFCAATTPFAGITEAGIQMRLIEGSGAAVPAFRGYLSIFLHNRDEGFYIGNSPRPGAYSFECESYPEGTGWSGERTIGLECNPADAAYDLLTGIFGKLGIPHAYIDGASFAAAAATLLAEGHGYSRAFEDGGTAEDMLGEICEQIDAVIRENPATDKIEIKLVRPDYEPLNTHHLRPDNCELRDYEAGSWENVVNKVRVTFPNRELNYQDDSAPAQNQANAFSQLGSPDEFVIRMPGVCTKELAEAIAKRELAFRSRPLAKCKAVCNRDRVRLSVGDVVRVSWDEYGISEMLFRVSKVDRGAPGSDSITLWLMQEAYFVRRGTVFPIEVAPFPVLIAE